MENIDGGNSNLYYLYNAFWFWMISPNDLWSSGFFHVICLSSDGIIDTGKLGDDGGVQF